MKILPRMLRSENIPLLRHCNMRINFRNINRTMPQYFLNIPDINISLQQACGKGMAEHMRGDVQVNRRKGCIPVDHSADSLI